MSRDESVEMKARLSKWQSCTRCRDANSSLPVPVAAGSPLGLALDGPDGARGAGWASDMPAHFAGLVAPCSAPKPPGAFQGYTRRAGEAVDPCQAAGPCYISRYLG